MFEIAPSFNRSQGAPLGRELTGVDARLKRGNQPGRIGAAEWILLSSIALCVLDGAIRKWVLRDDEGMLKYAPYFSKDFAFALILFIPRSQGIGEVGRKLWTYLRVGLAFCAIGALASTIFNWGSVNFVGAGLSMRSLFLLPLCALLVIPRLRQVSLTRVALLIGLLTLGNAALGTLQYSSPKDDPINYYASKQYEAAMFEESVRAMGTFPYITGFGTLAMVGAWAGTVLMSYGERRKWYFGAGVLTSAASLWCALLSISRGPTIVVITILLIWLLSSRGIFQNLLRVSAFVVLLAVVLFAFGRVSIFQRASETLLARNEAAEDIEQRLTPPIAEVVKLTSLVPFGAGFGSEQVGGVFAETGVMSFRQFESQFSRILMEIGALGLIGFLLVVGGLFIALYRAQRGTADRALRRSITTGAVLIVWLCYGNIIFDHVASFFVWSIAALLLAKAEQTAVHGIPQTS
jgi:O-antigen ligase